MKRFAIILAASLTIQALLLFSIWHFFFSGYGLIDFSFLFSALWFAFVLFFSTQAMLGPTESSPVHS